MPLIMADASVFFTRANSTDVDDTQGKLQCYGLPYGLFGFISHIVTYYTLFCLWRGLRPLMPFQHLAYGKHTFVVAISTLIGLIVTTTVNIVRCKNDWEPLVLAIWSLGMSLLNSFTHLHVAFLCWKGRRDWNNMPYGFQDAVWWVLLYIPGLVVGVIGLTSLVHKWGGVYPELRTITIIFWLICGSTFGLGLIITITMFMMRQRRLADGTDIVYYTGGPVLHDYSLTTKGFVWMVKLFVVLGMFYSDWALAIIMEDFFGVPSDEAKKPITWTYWVFKRLPMFSW